MSSIHEFVDRIVELAAANDGKSLSKNEAVVHWQELIAIFAETSKFLQRRFSRLSHAQQTFVLQLIAASEDNQYSILLQAWGQDASLGFAIRVEALKVAAKQGAAIDTPLYGGLLNVCQMLNSLQQESATALADDGNLQAHWRHAVNHLPLSLALGLGRQLSATHASIGLAVLRALLPAMDAQGTPSIVESIAQIALPESVEVLQALLTDRPKKGLQKIIKKALHRLRSQGLEVKDQSQRSQPVVIGASHLHLEKCLASHIDPEGDRVLWMIRTKPFGGFNIAYLVINYGSGIQAAYALQASKRELPQLLEQAQEKVRLIEIDPAYCQHQVAMAHQMNLETRTPVPEQFFAVQDIIGTTSEVFDQAFIYSVLSAAELEEARTSTDHSKALLDLPELAGWTLPMSIVQKYADMIREIEDSQIVVSSSLKDERIGQIYAQASEEVLGEEARRMMRLRLEETAYYLFQTERQGEALWAVAVAESLQAAPPRGQSHPFIEALLQRSLELAKERPGSRIIQPFAQPAPASESRLII
ncbi:MAG: hypothetical protein O7G88_05900 [bacterium]|nr:hypothetical protein [bacterium]